MRIAVVLAASALLAGCANQQGDQSGPARLTPITPSRTAETAPPGGATGTTPSTRSSVTSTAAPDGAAPVAEAIAWVESAPPVDGADYGVALRGATTTPLEGDVAFTTPSGTSCMTDTRHGSADLACLVNLTDPPPPPPDVYGVWKGGWVDFDGASVEIGSSHGDPGRFGRGQGPPLPQGGSLSFGDFRCRTDATALVCVNFARQTGVRYSDDGIDAYGCTLEARPPAGIGVKYLC
ncbi:hypothetical protein [Mycolicibacterium sp.]|uniref:hypothetical protein n=1 Tax=Mycolicibacterium sp. TaxID=2320850 RepID=UPI001D56E9F9|nr:hypothetical protein [Mycolicibacterium sp.]MCB1291970.1 hypothetical protein [Mycobacterium sp.]MCB9409067.1 hypothetical protein [Mycolicibacterium sp.]